jgi:hypothetical protein
LDVLEHTVFVRWVIRKHKNTSVADVTFHDAYLVESFRDDASNPRQRTICYLGNIRQMGTEFPSIERELFFLRAERILRSVPDMSGPDRQGVLRQLREKVLPLSDAEVIEAFQLNLRWYASFWRERGINLSATDLLTLIETAIEAEP